MTKEGKSFDDQPKEVRKFQIDPSMFPGIISNLKSGKKREPTINDASDLFGE